MISPTLPTPSPRPAPASRRAGVRRARPTSTRARLVGAAAALLTLGVLLVPLASPSGAWAAASPTPDPPGLGAPTPTPAPAPTPVAPTISPVADSATGTVVVSGTATPGARVKVAVGSSTTFLDLCATVQSDARGSWTCSGTVANGAGWTATARDLDQPGAPDVDSAPFSVLGAPSVQGGLLVGAKLSGTGEPGATITVTAASGATTTASASSSGSWSTVLPGASFPSGSYTVTATQSTAAVPDVPRSAASSAVAVRVDRDAPGAPRLTAPTAGQRITTQPFAVSGSGEPDTQATVYVDSSPVCQAVVTGGSWSCSTTGTVLPAGDHLVQASLLDAAGNYGSPSAGVVVTVPATASSPAPPPASTPRPGATTAPAPTTPPLDGGESAAPGAPPTTGGGQPGGGAGSGGVADDGRPADAPQGTWATATSFGEHLPSPGQALGGTTWLLAAGLALAFLLLVAGPARLAALSARGSRRPRLAPLTGRNRGVELPTSFSDVAVSPWVPVALTLLGGAVVTAVAAGVDDQVQYARLVAGIGLGLVVLNGLGVVVPAALVAARRGLAPTVRMSPRLLLAAVAACAATRFLSLDPALVLGVLLVGGLAPSPAAPAARRAQADAQAAGLADADGPGRTPGPRDRGVLAAAQLASVTLLATAAWIAHSAIASGGFWPQLLRETLATVCLAGLGSLVLALVPLGSLPGRAVWGWSRVGYVALAVVGVTIAAIVFVGAPSGGFPVGSLLAATAVGALGIVAAWLWVRFVEPAGREA